MVNSFQAIVKEKSDEELLMITMCELGRSMIHAVTIGYPKHILEIPDIKQLAKA